jgi:hypothetical protein
MWPLFLGIVIVSYSKIGLLVSVSLFLGLIILVVVGRFVDNGGSRFLLKLGPIFGIAVNSLRIGVPFAGVYAATITDNVAESILKAPYYKILYGNANKIGRVQYIVRTEQAGHTARVLMLVILLACTYIMSDKTVLMASFAIAGAASLATPLIKKRY